MHRDHMWNPNCVSHLEDMLTTFWWYQDIWMKGGWNMNELVLNDLWKICGWPVDDYTYNMLMICGQHLDDMWITAGQHFNYIRMTCRWLAGDLWINIKMLSFACRCYMVDMWMTWGWHVEDMYRTWAWLICRWFVNDLGLLFCSKFKRESNNLSKVSGGYR